MNTREKLMSDIGVLNLSHLSTFFLLFKQTGNNKNSGRIHRRFTEFIFQIFETTWIYKTFGNRKFFTSIMDCSFLTTGVTSFEFQNIFRNAFAMLIEIECLKYFNHISQQYNKYEIFILFFSRCGQIILIELTDRLIELSNLNSSNTYPIHLS